MDKVDEEMAADFNVDFGADIGTQIPNVSNQLVHCIAYHTNNFFISL
jgi:hypothetical protein